MANICRVLRSTSCDSARESALSLTLTSLWSVYLAIWTEILRNIRVLKIESHMCAFGMHDSDHQGGVSVKNANGFMTIAVTSAKESEKPCSGDHRHVVLIGGSRARRGQVYPDELCKSKRISWSGTRRRRQQRVCVQELKTMKPLLSTRIYPERNCQKK